MRYKSKGDKMKQTKSTQPVNNKERKSTVIYAGPYLSSGSAPVSYSYSGVIKPNVIRNQTADNRMFK